MAFALSLLCKPTTIAIPLLLLILDYWPLRRLNARAVLEKIPFLLVAGVSDLIKAEIAREVVTDLWNAAGAPVTTFSVGAVSGTL